MRKVLILDDNADILQIVTEVLVYEGYQVRGINTGAELFALAESYLPDLILLDYRLPDANGGELCRELKLHPQLKDIPVIIFTAYQDPKLDLSTYGCEGVISKPFDLDNLTRAIDALILAD
ncbi:MAG: response regulator [Mucilaginibacter sp.]|uniref:response regulator n=1 Tax=Mucilaginibacter sp. TaxID=1882438 RepID=UPI0031B2E4A8